MTGHKPGRMVIWDFEYGPDYSGPGEDVLREDRAIGDPFQGDNSNFLHPVLYYYISFPSSFKGLGKGKLPPPDLYHHIVEDFLTDWSVYITSITVAYRKVHFCPFLTLSHEKTVV
ncbi:FAD-dependent oxidoreductase domain-containing protein 2 [Geodia barretti]|uniref:FAD-dependent oxidoreductase domain-containing protein 2 n=1 Tax=Geodia barretti TaxID=519541 RepID=A0AA35X9R9_GEOBA|nr:FAD-dependent oxidoreductase domain-containing protein 2 [Geodia barretti]